VATARSAAPFQSIAARVARAVSGSTKCAPRERRARRGDREAGQADEIQPSVTAHVAELPEQRHRERDREERTGDHEGEHRRARTEVVGDLGNRDREDRHREAGGEQTGEHGGEEEPAVRIAVRRAVAVASPLRLRCLAGAPPQGPRDDGLLTDDLDHHLRVEVARVR